MTSTTLPQSNRAGLAMIQFGGGRPVLLLHGVGLRAEAWHAQIDALSSEYLVIAPHMPGHGGSPCADTMNSLGDFADAYLPLVESLSEPALVIGHSMGALIALDLACRMPSHVCGVAALNGVFKRSAQATAAVQARASKLDGQQAPDPAPTLERWFGSAPSPARSACETWLRGADPAGYKRAYKAFASAQVPSEAALKTLSCPALFATGALEPNSTPKMSHEMASLAPQGKAIIVDDAAHMMPMTHPAAVNKMLLEFAQELRT